MSKSTGKKNIRNKRVAVPKEELSSSSGDEEEKVGSVFPKARQLSLVEQQASRPTPVLGKKEDIEKSGLKRNYDDADEDGDVESGTDINTMLKAFGSDMTKAISAKKRRVESFTAGSMRANLKMVVEPWGNQLTSHVEMADCMYKLCTSILNQADVDFAQMKEHDEKMIKLFQQQMKANLQSRTLIAQRNTACRQLLETHMTNVKDQETKHRNELNAMQCDLKKELSILQKKMLNEGHKEEMDNVKKNLSNMFYSGLG